MPRPPPLTINWSATPGAHKLRDYRTYLVGFEACDCDRLRRLALELRWLVLELRRLLALTYAA